MKILRFQVDNFGSYEHLALDLADTGLALVYGQTGSGKSTITDIPYWILFGQTSKDVSVDQVRSWNTPNPTIGFLTLEIKGSTIRVMRTRGVHTKNDLNWSEDGQVHRGKDLADTQRLLNERLGVDANLYALGAYFHEFSPISSFFTSKSKERREILERITSLILPVKLAAAASETRKEAKQSLGKLELELSKATGRLEMLEHTLKSSRQSSQTWVDAQRKKLQYMQSQADNFAEIKAVKLAEFKEKGARWDSDQQNSIAEVLKSIADQYTLIRSLELKVMRLLADPNNRTHCKACGQITGEGLKYSQEARELEYNLKTEQEHLVVLHKLHTELIEESNPFLEDFDREEKRENHYEEVLERERQNVNPFLTQAEDLKAQMHTERLSINLLTTSISTVESRISALQQLYDLSFELRGVMLQNSVKEVETETNRILETYFDAEIRVGFTLEGSDSLQVSIQKSGSECVYKQLSKGQRGLLKLAFAVSIMKAASNNAGVHFDNLFLDEALDGLDTALKLKAFSLMEELAQSHGSVFIIDHCEEFHQMFSKRFYVTLCGDRSQVEICE